MGKVNGNNPPTFGATDYIAEKKEGETNKKTCSMCKKSLPLTRKNFYIDNSRKDGFAGICINCKKLKYDTKNYPELGILMEKNRIRDELIDEVGIDKWRLLLVATDYPEFIDLMDCEKLKEILKRRK